MLKSPRFLLFIVWLLGYASAFIVICSFVPLGFTVADALQANLTQLTGIFAPYLGPVVCYWFAKDVATKTDTYDRATFLVAIICSVFFNVVIFVLLISIYFRESGAAKIEQTLLLMSQVATLLAFLVGPAIGFFFGQSGKDSKPARSPAVKAPKPPPPPET